MMEIRRVADRSVTQRQGITTDRLGPAEVEGGTREAAKEH